MEQIISKTEEELMNILSIEPDALSSDINKFLETEGSKIHFLDTVRKEFDVKLTTEILSSQTVEELAALIEIVIDMNESKSNKPVKNGLKKGTLSHNQYRMYWFDQMEGNKMLYNMPFKFYLNGRLDINILQSALDLMVIRHESLRTNFKKEGHGIVQHVSEEYNHVIQYEDLRHLSSKQASLKVESYLDREVETEFDLENDPLFTMKVLQIQDEKYNLLCNFHHIIFDGISFEIFFKELLEMYELIQKGRTIEFSSAEMQYLDYSTWNKDWIDTNTEKQTLFWGNYLHGEDEALSLPYDFQRPKNPSYSGDRLEIELPSELHQSIHKIVKQSKLTMFIFMMTAYQTFLSRYTGQHQITVGSTVANREQDEFARTIGCFVNTLPFRLKINEAGSFHMHLLQNRSLILEVLEQQAFPFDKIVEIVNPKRNLSMSPLFQTTLVMEESFNEVYSNSFFSIHKESFNVPFSNYDVTIKVRNLHHCVIEFEYSSELFERETIKRLANSFEKWLFQICKHMKTPIKELEYLDDDQLELLLLKWHGNKKVLKDETIISAFKRVVHNQPDKIAIVDNKENISFLDLDKKSSMLASLIRSYIKEDTYKSINKVGLHINRSIDMVIGMLGIIKAGCAYIPLDPKLPPERLDYIIKNSRLDICVTDQMNSTTINNKIGKIINVEDIEHKNMEFCSANTLPTDQAYIIYTSGTTGNPKGVMLSHKGVVNLVASQNKYLQLNTESKVLQFVTFNFDASIYEIFGSLLNGAELHIGNNREEFFDLLPIEQQIKSEKITHLVLPPAILKELDIENSDVKYVGSAGSECPPELVEKYENFYFYNAYGPTEYSVWTTFEMFNMREIKNDKSNKIPIGKPILNTEVFLLNTEQKPVPIGAVGELHIGGEGLAIGYIGNEKLTNEKFIKHPFKSGERLYRSGDLAKFTSDGKLIFLGREDNQVKIRGFRVELDEILSNIKQFPHISDAYIKIQNHDNLNPQVIAYFIAEKKIETNQLKMFLKEKLPDYMIPTFFMQIKQFPLNVNGKVDSAKLPPPITESDEVLEEPRTDIEKVLLQIFKKVLGVNQLSIHDNFFEYGGDSIQSIQISSMAREKGIIINTKSIFENQSVAELAIAAEFQTSELIGPVETSGYVELTPIQEWFFRTQINSINHWNQSIVFSEKYCAQEQEVERILEKIVDHHEGLQTLFRIQKNKYIGFIDPNHRTCDLLYFDIHHLDEKTQQRKIDELETEAQQSLNIENGPMMKMLIFKEAHQKYRFFWVIHHLLVDAVSWSILLEDFKKLHQGVLNNQFIKLPNKTSSFKDWSNYLKKYNELELDFEIERYWKEKTNETVSDFSIAKYFTEKEEKEIEKIFTETETKFLVQELAANSKATVEEILLSLISQSMSRAFEIDSLWVEIEGHGREETDTTIDISRTVGWFTVMYPLLLRPDSTLSKTMKNVKNAIREVPNKGFDYGIIKYLRQDEIEAPNSYVTFNYLGKLSSQLESSNSKDFGHLGNQPKLNFLAAIQDEKLTIRIISKLSKDKVRQLIEGIEIVTNELMTSKLDQDTLIESDFPNAEITQDDLLHILNSMD